MSRIKRLKTIGWILLGIWFFRPLFFRLINLDFSSVEYVQNYRMIWIVLFPAAILLLTTKSWDFTKSVRNNFKILMILIISLGFIVVVNFFSMMVEWDFSKGLKHKTEDRRLVLRTIDGGALTKSDQDDSKLVEVVSWTKYFYKYHPVDRSKLNMDEWE
jgi:hypothetical protein